MDPTSQIAAKVKRARFYYHRTQYPECLEHATDALTRDPEDPEALYLAGMAALLDGQKQQAKTFATSLLSVEPEEPFSHYLIGHCRLAVDNDPYNAETHFRTALRLAPEVPDFHANLGIFLANRGRVEEGITVTRKGLKVDPSSAPGRQNPFQRRTESTFTVMSLYSMG